jgi:hypothetical protein
MTVFRWLAIGSVALNTNRLLVGVVGAQGRLPFIA